MDIFRSENTTRLSVDFLNKDTTTATLKALALISMTIDHIAAVIFEPFLFFEPEVFSTGTRIVMSSMDMLSRIFGRIAFPLFLFMMVEGFFFTHNRGKYLSRLLIFALISEPFFDMACGYKSVGFKGLSVFAPNMQNIYFTLSIGFIAIWVIHTVLNRYEESGISLLDFKREDKRMEALCPVLAVAGISIIAFVAAEFCHCDYNWIGVVPMIVGYLFHRYGASKKKMFVAMIISIGVLNPLEFFAILALPFIKNYNGEQGPKLNKWFFYAYYPAHMFLFAIIRCMIAAVA